MPPRRPEAPSAPTRVPTACPDHPCDGCKRCRRGACCHWDRPDYRLPEVGDWDGPIYGRVGVLATDGALAQCHACGGWYGNVGNHVVRSHDLTPDEYRAIFSLRARTGLAGPRTKALARRQALRYFPPYWADPPPGSAMDLTPEQRSLRSRRWRQRIPTESKLDPAVREAWARNGRHLTERLRQRKSEGHVWPRARDTRAAMAPAIARWRELMRDPDYRASMAAKSRALAAPRRRRFTCKQCGASFTRSATWTGHEVCSKACELALKSRLASERNVSRRPDVRARILDGARRRGGRSEAYDRAVARLSALAPEAWASLSERARLVVRLFYGLEDGRPWTQGAIAERLQVRRESVRDVLHTRAVERLLAADA